MPSAVGYQPTLALEMGLLQERITTTKTGSITSFPDDMVSGYVLGIVGEADNGRVVEVFGPEMSIYRLSLIEEVFLDSFESP